MAISVTQPEARISIKQDFKSQNLSQFLRFGSNFLQVSSILIQVQLLYSNLGSDTIPSLISQGGGADLAPPLDIHRILTTSEVGLNGPYLALVSCCVYFFYILHTLSPLILLVHLVGYCGTTILGVRGPSSIFIGPQMDPIIDPTRGKFGDPC